ncbi:MAG: hypothetical protein ABIN99_04615 [Nitrosospira sp.]
MICSTITLLRFPTFVTNASPTRWLEFTQQPKLHSLHVPETFITNDPELVLAFQREHGTIIYKSISGVRSIVKALDENDLARLDNIRWCPVPFRALVPEADVRVHVVDREVFPTEIVSDTVDYRYARRNGGSAELRAVDLAPDVAERCLLLSAKN